MYSKYVFDTHSQDSIIHSMALTKEDLQDIKGVVGEVVEERVGGIIEQKVPGIVERVVEPYFQAIQKDFNNVNERFDRLEGLINDDYKHRIENLEVQVKELRDALAMK